MSKVISVPKEVEDALTAALLRMYPELEGRIGKDIERTTFYEFGKEAKIRYEATVKYYFEGSYSTALFQYAERVNTKERQLEYFWYCRKDWND